MTLRASGTFSTVKPLQLQLQATAGAHHITKSSPRRSKRPAARYRHHWQWVPLFVQQSTELQLAPAISGRYHLRGWGYDLLNLALAQFMGGFRLHQIVNTGRTAAEGLLSTSRSSEPGMVRSATRGLNLVTYR